MAVEGRDVADFCALVIVVLVVVVLAINLR
jgi:hypothetical protein